MSVLSDERLRAVLDAVPTDWQGRPGFREAAVLAPWFTRDDRDWLLLTRRQHDLPHHAGQISFPGGAREGEESPVACALRETEEEIGVAPPLVTVLGGLPPRLSIGKFWVQAVVGRIPPDVELTPDPREVAAVVAFPLDRLRDRSRWEDRAPDTDATRRAMPHFDHAGETLWGLTARFTLDLIERLDAADR